MQAGSELNDGLGRWCGSFEGRVNGATFPACVELWLEMFATLAALPWGTNGGGDPAVLVSGDSLNCGTSLGIIHDPNFRKSSWKGRNFAPGRVKGPTADFRSYSVGLEVALNQVGIRQMVCREDRHHGETPGRGLTMNLTGPAYTEATSEAEEDGVREIRWSRG